LNKERAGSVGVGSQLASSQRVCPRIHWPTPGSTLDCFKNGETHNAFRIAFRGRFWYNTRV